MKQKSHSNALLVELLIVVLFFMLASTVLLQLFAAARSESAKAETLSEASFLAQNIAETLYWQGDGSLDSVSVASDDRISFPGSSLTAAVEYTAEQTDAGTMNRYLIHIYSGEDLVFTLPAACFQEVAS